MNDSQLAMFNTLLQLYPGLVMLLGSYMKSGRYITVHAWRYGGSSSLWLWFPIEY